MKKGLSLLLCLMLMLGTVGTAWAETALPITETPITLTFVATQSPNHVDWNEMSMWKELERRTGIHIDFEMIPSTSLAEKRNLILASNDLPDAFMSSGLPPPISPLMQLMA